ncbi:MAG TPA: acetyl-CoA carboxylase, carboxyltransferase subunit beta [Opitutaceae bacterium]|nr:acetyl-CoA carboxylase, carboxyltransferase subunit beta [Opitutaceae bacterium]
MALFGKPKYTPVIVKKKDIPKGTYTKDPVSGDSVFTKELEQNQMVFPKSGFHYPISAPARLARLLDEGSFQETDAGLTSIDPLGFTGTASYTSKLEQYRKETGLNDAVVTGFGRIHGIEVSIACMDFRFLGASMGAVVGEKITRAIEAATARKIPCIVICSSGGARMYEGIYSLMQMAKTSAALARHAQARLPYISILTNPTMAGVMASYATLGDVILAEPGAVVGFAGPRVIKETTKQSLPDGFQTAEFLLKHGLIDQIVSRLDMRDRLRDLLTAFAGGRRAA